MAAYDPDRYSKAVDSTGHMNAFLKICLSKVKWGSSEIVLDIGSGPGNVTLNILWKALRGKGVDRIIGMDCDSLMVENATKKQSCEKVSFIKGDIQDKDSISADWEGKFDKVFSSFAFQDIIRMREAFQNVNWLLKDSGTVCIMMASAVPLTNVQLESFKALEWKHHFKGKIWNLCSSNEIFCNMDIVPAFQCLLAQCGFECLSCWTEFTYQEFKNADDFKEFAFAIDANQKLIPENLHKAYKEYMYGLLIQDVFQQRSFHEIHWDKVRVVDDNGVHRYYSQLLHIIAKKL